MYNPRYPLYLRAYINSIRLRMEELKNESPRKETLLKVVIYGIKTTRFLPESTTYDESINEFNSISSLKQIIADVTPNEFMNLFPIEKDFKGYKYEIKDYYSTMEYINTLDLNKPIGDNVSMFLAEYTNEDIDEFFVKAARCLSDLRQYDGHISMFEEFMAAQGLKTPNTFKTAKGEVMYVRNGKPEEIGFKTNKLELVK